MPNKQIHTKHLIIQSSFIRSFVMVAVTHLLAPATMPHNPDSLSVLSYNVLLPNSVDAWWTYKMYSPPLSESDRHIGDWVYRRKLIEQRVSNVDADIVCFQEVSPTSFDSDFSFMAELGYDGVELFRKGMRWHQSI